MFLNKKIIEFFKRHNLYDEDMFNYFIGVCQFVDYYDDSINFSVSCPPRIDENGRICGFSLVLPYSYDEKTILVSIHELGHAIYWYKKMGRKYDEKKHGVEIELFPMVLERLYLEENRTPELEKLSQFLDSTIDDDSPIQYRFALASRDSMMKTDISNFKYMDRATRKLAKKWKRENR